MAPAARTHDQQGQGQQGQQPSREEVAQLKAAIEALGARLEGGGGLQNEEGDPILDIRESLEEAEAGGASAPAAAADMAQQQPGSSAGEPAAAAGSQGAEAEAEEDDFEALMQRMEQLEWEEAAAGVATAPDAACFPPAAQQCAPLAQQLQQKPAKQAPSGKRAGGGFKPGFLLGKSLEDPSAARQQPTGMPASSTPMQQAAAAAAGAGQQRQPRWLSESKDASAAFTGAVVERPVGQAAPPPAATGSSSRGGPGREQQPLPPTAVERPAVRGGPAAPEPAQQQQQQQQQQQAQEVPRVSRFKQRRQGAVL